MIDRIRRAWNQWRIKRSVIDCQALGQTLFDYDHGKWTELVSGPDTEQVSRQIEGYVEELVHSGRERVLVIILNSTQDAGYIMGMNHNKAHEIRWFKYGIFEMAEAMADISDWCKGAY